MNKVCEVCRGEGRYKCPTCFIFYCSVACCKIHREENCEVLVKTGEEEKDGSAVKKRKIDIAEDEVSEEKLESLKSNEEVNKLLKNPHLRNLLTTVDNADNAEEIMQKAMQEPIFVEFADTCLKVVDPESSVDPMNLNKTE